MIKKVLFITAIAVLTIQKTVTSDIKKETSMKPNSKIYVAGHRGLVGSAIVRKL